MITSIQKYVCLSTIARVNALSTIAQVNVTSIFLFRLRSWQDLQTWLDECLALLKDKHTSYAMYTLVTSERYSCLYVDLTAKDTNQICH